MTLDAEKKGALWHTLSLEAVCAELASPLTGLTEAEAQARFAAHGPNELAEGRRTTAWHILAEQFKNVLIVILLIATALSAFLGHGIEATAIAVIVLLAIVLGFVQEYRAERAIESLRRMAAPTAMVLRDGRETKVPARELVPGDIVLLHPGDRVPADLRLVEAVNLKVEESVLTGESVAVEKHTDMLPSADAALGDRKNVAYSGTAVAYGRGRGMVTATGMQTEFGKIARLLDTVEAGRSPLQENLDKLGRTLARVALALVALVVAFGVYRGQPFIDMFIFGISLAVAVVPEALPAVVTISLAIGVRRMVKRHALMRHLPAVETLGSTSVICTDKTGTLTKDEMTVRRVFVGGRLLEVSGAGYEPKGDFFHADAPLEPTVALRELLRAGVLANDAHVTYDEAERRWDVKGDPTEGALVVVAAKAGLKKETLDDEFPRVGEIPFTSETKRMTTLHEGPAGKVVYAKGAPELVLASAASMMTDDGTIVPLTTHEREAVLASAQNMADKALRVLGLAFRSGAGLDVAEHDMVFLGLVGMIDPPRPEAKAAILTCEEAGIRPVMMTGDHPTTAGAVARELGLLKTGRVVTGAELDAMSEEEFEREVERIEVYARVSPEHKLRVVGALQGHGHVVAMTGDGVNDAPALKKADIGIAMGITGSDVAKEAAVMSLTDDNFASIVAAVEEGRGIFGNIKKYLMYLLSSNIGEIGLIIAASAFGLPLPLTAVQILYVNLATDGLPALALAVDPPDADIMRKRPRDPRDGIFTRPVVSLIVTGGLWSMLVNIGLFSWALSSGRTLAEAMALTFISLVLIQLLKAYSFRSFDHLVLRRLFSNPWLNLAVLWELLVLFAIVYVPFLQTPFGTFGLSPRDWAVSLGLCLTVLPVLELAKWTVKRIGHSEI